MITKLPQSISLLSALEAEGDDGNIIIEKLTSHRSEASSSRGMYIVIYICNLMSLAECLGDYYPGQ